MKKLCLMIGVYFLALIGWCSPQYLPVQVMNCNASPTPTCVPISFSPLVVVDATATPTTTPNWTIVNIPTTILSSSTPFPIATATSGKKHDVYLSENNLSGATTNIGHLNTGVQFFLDPFCSSGSGIVLMYCPDAIGNTTTYFTGNSGVRVGISGFMIEHK